MERDAVKTGIRQNNELLDSVSTFIYSLLSRFDGEPVFHSWSHTKEVADVALKLARQHNLEPGQTEIIALAAWFYYSGYFDSPKDYVLKSVENARKFLGERSYPEERIDQVLSLLKAKASPDSEISAKVLHDAIISYKGRKRFFAKAELLRLERENLFGKSYSDHEWEKIMYKSLLNCTFLTDVARQEFQSRKNRNISKQRKLIHDAYKTTVRKKTGKEFGRGVDTLYRANFNNHIRLSSIADGKANMMISINTIILSVIVTLSGAGFTFSSTFMVQNLRFVLPIFILLVGSLISVVFAILSARPNVTSHEVSMKEVERGESSLLFFGNFIQVPLNEFIDYLGRLKKSQKKLYDSMSIDLYFLGKVLQRKYRLLQWSYTVFMAALILSVISFSAIFFYSNF